MGVEIGVDDEGNGCVIVTSANIFVWKSPDETTKSILPVGGFGEGGEIRESGSSCWTKKPEALAMVAKT